MCIIVCAKKKTKLEWLNCTRSSCFFLYMISRLCLDYVTFLDVHDKIIGSIFLYIVF